ncbi:hypothetical protein GCM10022216_08380 [Sphingobacterium kyonggiense]|uniref:Uncharacterized protein n=1 Tax=Sphingobacterium kyonggiense TaxID=714075 RepID=A0ABP7YEF2_9SPHI
MDVLKPGKELNNLSKQQTKGKAAHFLSSFFFETVSLLDMRCETASLLDNKFEKRIGRRFTTYNTEQSEES